MTGKINLFSHKWVWMPTLIALIIQVKPIVDRTWADYKPLTRKDIIEIVMVLLGVPTASGAIVHSTDKKVYTPKGFPGRDPEDADGDGVPDIQQMAVVPSPIVTTAKPLTAPEVVITPLPQQSIEIEEPIAMHSQSPKRIIINHDTHLKASTADSSTLATDQKVYIAKGSSLPYSSYTYEDGLHFRVTLGKDGDGQQMVLKGRNTWLFYVPHIEIVDPAGDSLGAAVSPKKSELVPERGLDLIREFEGFDPNAYPDPIYGWEVPTIGYGTTVYPDGRKVRQGDTCTREQANQYLIDHVVKTCSPVLEKIPTWGQMNENQRGAIYSFAYNLGAHFYGGEGFTSISLVCDSPGRWDDRPWVQEQFVKYRNPGSNAEAGLLRRRRAEAELFCS